MPWTRTTRIDVLLTMAAVLLVSGPMLFTDSGFAEDFTNALWMTWTAGKMLAEAGHPEFFIDSTLGVFYPLFAFYGGPLFMATGALSELLGGNAVIAFVAMTMLAIAGAYGGVLWLGRQFGLRGLLAHAPALAVVTSAYYITNLYGRGDWSEFMVTSAIAPLLASSVYLVRAKNWRALPIAIFVASAALFTGGHNITLLWGTTLIVGVLLTLWLVCGAPRRLPYRRLAMLAGLGLASALLNAWFLLPDFAYVGKVVIAHSLPSYTTANWDVTKEFNQVGVVLDPLRRVPRESSTPALYVQAPDWFILWSIVAAALLLRPRFRGSGLLRRMWIATLAILLALLGMILVKPFWLFVGYPYVDIQFPYRLSTYVFFAAAGLVCISALALQRAAAAGQARLTVKYLQVGLLTAVAVSLSLCVWQEWVPNPRFGHSYAQRSEALVSPNIMPNSWYDSGYRNRDAPLIDVPSNRALFIPPSAVQGDRFEAWMNLPPGRQPILTDIDGGAYLVHIGGLRVVGKNPLGLMVVARPNGGSGPVHVVLETTSNAAVQLGRVLSLAAASIVLLILACAVVRGRRKAVA